MLDLLEQLGVTLHPWRLGFTGHVCTTLPVCEGKIIGLVQKELWIRLAGYQIYSNICWGKIASVFLYGGYVMERLHRVLIGTGWLRWF